MNDYLSKVKFDEKGLVPAIVQDNKTNEVLMLAYMNKESLQMTVETKLAHYWSRSRQKLWKKGETSGHLQYIKDISVDCDGDTLLLKVEQIGAACHTGNNSCFYRELMIDDIKDESAIVFKSDKGYNDKANILQEVYNIIEDRLNNPKEGSYTNYLFEKGLDKILKKVGEEASEVIIAAKNKAADEIQYEVADLFYHIMVLLVERDLKLDDIYDELKSRR